MINKYFKRNRISERKFRKIVSPVKANFKKEQLVECIVEADSAMLITIYERQIKQMEEKRIVLDAKIAKCGSVNERLLKISRTFLDFLRKLHEYWDFNNLMGKRTVLKETFSQPVAYSMMASIITYGCLANL